MSVICILTDPLSTLMLLCLVGKHVMTTNDIITTMYRGSFCLVEI